MTKSSNTHPELVRRLPVTVLSGFHGSGKTTLLNYILRTRQELKVAVIVGDRNEDMEDAQLMLMQQEGVLLRTEEALVEMSNGAFCCTVRQDLIRTVKKLVLEGQFDYILIELSDSAELMPVAQAFSFVDEANNVDLARVARLDTMVVVVDAFNFARDFSSLDLVYNRKQNEDSRDNRTIVNVLTDQIEFADVIILNKTDLLFRAHVGELKAILHKLNPKAKLIESQFGKVDPDELLNTERFNFDKVSQSVGWSQGRAAAGLKNYRNSKDHVPEVEEYGISSFIFRDRRPFHPTRFWKYVSDNFPPEIIRSKGLFWLVSRPDDALNFSQAGGCLRAESDGVWWASMPFNRRIQYDSFLENQKFTEAHWHNRFGDRQNEFVIMGQDLKRKQITKELQGCLCTELELRHGEMGGSFDDPFLVLA